MPESIEQALAECLERVARGEGTPEEMAARYPSLRAELEPLLALARDLRQLPKLEAPESLRSSKRPAFSSKPVIEPLELPASRRVSPSARLVSLWSAPFARLAAGIAVAFLLFSGATSAAAGSLPEEPLYPVKLAMEELQLAVAPSAQARAELEMRLADRRLEEVESAARQGRMEAVQRGLALYEERVESVMQRLEASPSASDEPKAEQARDVLDRQQQLARVLEQVPEQAKPAIVRAMETSSRDRDRSEKPESPADGRARSEVPTIPTVSAVAVAATPEATATAGTRHAEIRESAGESKHEATATSEGDEQEMGRKPKQKEEDTPSVRGAARPDAMVEETPPSGPKSRGLVPTSTPAAVAMKATPSVGPPTPAVPAATPTATRGRPVQGREKEQPSEVESTPKPANEGKQDSDSKEDSRPDKEEKESTSKKTK